MKAAAARLLVEEKAAYPKVAPPCPYVGTCGGCTLQDLAYPDQLALKQQRLRRAFEPLGPVPEVELVGLEDPWRYRNKAELTFGDDRGRLVLGYHAARSFWRVVDVDDCLLLPQPAAAVMRDIRQLAQQTGLPPYYPKTHQGFFRYLLVRASHATGRVLLCLMTTSATGGPPPQPGWGGGGQDGVAAARAVVAGIAREVLARHPAVSSFYWGLTNQRADIAVPEQLVLLEGDAYLEDRVGPFRLKLHPMSFLQPSSVQADRIYTRLAQAIGERPGGIVWDLYCGMGLIAFYLSAQAGTVYAIDAEPRYVELAAINAALNGLTNIVFQAGQVEARLKDRRFWLQEAKPDVIVVDPPRAGLHPQVIPSLLAARPKQLAYLSCNAQSLVRDLQLLQSGFPRYRIAAIHAFDMFPQTSHVETLVLLDR